MKEDIIDRIGYCIVMENTGVRNLGEEKVAEYYSDIADHMMNGEEEKAVELLRLLIEPEDGHIAKNIITIVLKHIQED